MTSEGWVIVGALCALAGTSLAVRHLTAQTTVSARVGFLVVLVVAGGLGYWVAEDLDRSGPLGLAAGLAMVEAAPWVWRLIQRVVEKRVDKSAP